MIIIYTLFANKKEAQKIVGQLVDSRLVACANCWPVESCYIWQGKKEKAKEYACFLKTLKKNYKKVNKFIAERHSYDVPFISAINPIEVFNGYKRYIKNTVSRNN